MIAAVVGHLRDGGTHLEVKINDRTFCELQAAYNTLETSQSARTPGQHGIERLSTCPQSVPVNGNDTLQIVAHYNTLKNLPSFDSGGGLGPVMGIALVYVARGGSLPIDAASKEIEGDAE